jgi:hypothetical protein
MSVKTLSASMAVNTLINHSFFLREAIAELKATRTMFVPKVEITSAKKVLNTKEYWPLKEAELAFTAVNEQTTKLTN